MRHGEVLFAKVKKIGWRIKNVGCAQRASNDHSKKHQTVIHFVNLERNIEPLDFIARLAALVPKPRVNLTRFHGVFAPNSKHRLQVTRPNGEKDRSYTQARTLGWKRRLKSGIAAWTGCSDWSEFSVSTSKPVNAAVGRLRSLPVSKIRWWSHIFLNTWNRRKPCKQAFSRTNDRRNVRLRWWGCSNNIFMDIAGKVESRSWVSSPCCSVQAKAREN